MSFSIRKFKVDDNIHPHNLLFFYVFTVIVFQPQFSNMKSIHLERIKSEMILRKNQFIVFLFHISDRKRRENT